VRARRTQAEFVALANEIHSGLYDYSKVEYVNKHTKVEIICGKHGSFWMRPCIHLCGSGCQICGRNKSNTTRSLGTCKFVEKATIIHNGRYDYSMVCYINNHTKVKIVCPVHGEFEQFPVDHLVGKGCMECGGRRKLTKQEFEAKARKIHGDIYIYNSVVYVNNSTPVDILCRKHGIFSQTPSHHLCGQGCRKCAFEMLSEKLRLTTETFIQRAKEIHGDKYDYSRADYRNAHRKIVILCAKHGEFLQEPCVHLWGCGCPKCGFCASKMGKQWLDSLGIDYKPEQPIISKTGRTYVVDGFSKIENLVMEYFGGFWNGNPNLYDSNDINPKNGLTFGILCDRTISKVAMILKDGYDLLFTWGK